MWKTRYPLMLCCSWDPHRGVWDSALQYSITRFPCLCLFLCLISPHRKAKGFSSYFARNGSWKLTWLFYSAVHISSYTQHAGALQTPWVRALLLCCLTLTFCCYISLQKHPFRDFSVLICIEIKCSQCKISLWTQNPNSCWLQRKEFQWLQWSYVYLCESSKLSWAINIKSNIILISTELLFTQMFFGVVYIFTYSLDVIVHVAVALLYNLGQTHTDSPVFVSFFLFLYWTGWWREQLLYKLWIPLLVEVMQIL